jgi:hypothetical protein
VEDLEAGESREVRYELRPLFPQLLGVGEFDFTYRLEEAPHAQPQAAARFTVESGPESVEFLLELLDSGERATRARAASLLHRMTGRGFDYDVSGSDQQRSRSVGQWRQWWREYGRKLRWDPRAQGASGQGWESMTPDSGRQLGGVIFPAVPFAAKQRRGLLASLAAWMERPAKESLQGDSAVADRLIDYPQEPAVFEKDNEIAACFCRVLTLLSQHAENVDGWGAVEILNTVARFPHRPLVSQLAALAAELETLESRPDALTVCSGLLNWLDPRRVPAEL